MGSQNQSEWEREIAMAKATPERTIQQAMKWVGYLEKKSNKNLDDFTANAGKNNYVRFNRDYVAEMKGRKYPGSINMQWCAAFVSCVFMYEYGVDAARELLCGDLSCYTPAGSNYFKKVGRYTPRKKADPQPGDVVYFYSASKGRIGHVGLVYAVDKTTVYTIEGNTSGGSSLVTNGGAVWKKSYKKTSTYIDGYGRPLYDAIQVPGEVVEPQPETLLGKRILRKGMKGGDVKELQSILIEWGYDLGKYGADGDFGAKTQSAVENFQRTNGLEDDGVYGAMTHAALMKRLATETEQPVDDGDGEEQEPAEDVVTPPDNTGEPTGDDDENPDASGEEDPPKEANRVIRITGATVNVRTQPNTGGKIVFVAKKGDMLAFSGMESADGWYGVVCEGELAWVSGKYAGIVEIDEPEIKPEPLPTEDDPRAIIDISVYQTIKDAEKMARHVKLCIHRASIGLKNDAKWDKHAKLMQGAGILFGAYHYVKAKTAAEAVQEARVFYASASPHNPIFYCADMEWTGIAKGRARNVCTAFIAELKRLGARKTGIYVGHHLYKLWNLDYKQVDFVWIPRYSDRKTNIAGKPGKWPAYPCDIHQYSSGGSIPGIAGRIDMNRIVPAGIGFEELIRR